MSILHEGVVLGQSERETEADNLRDCFILARPHRPTRRLNPSLFLHSLRTTDLSCPLQSSTDLNCLIPFSFPLLYARTETEGRPYCTQIGQHEDSGAPLQTSDAVQE
jgi:hypothetical protein